MPTFKSKMPISLTWPKYAISDTSPDTTKIVCAMQFRKGANDIVGHVRVRCFCVMTMTPSTDPHQKIDAKKSLTSALCDMRTLKGSNRGPIPYSRPRPIGMRSMFNESRWGNLYFSPNMLQHDGVLTYI